MQPYQLPVIIDVEASGFGNGSYPIEIGVALEDSSTHCFLIKPETEWTHWDVNSELLHGITRKVLYDCGCDAYEVADKLNKLLAGKTVYSDGWAYDQTWLHLLFDVAGMEMQFKLESLVYLFNEKQMNSWDRIKKEVMERTHLKRHRASNDALVLQRTYDASHV